MWAFPLPQKPCNYDSPLCYTVPLATHSRPAYVNQVRMTVLASGSKGNATLVSSGRTRILVDAGLSCRELLRRLQIAGEDPSLLSAILITHEHQDHVFGLATLARRLRIPVFFTEPTHRAWVRMLTPRTTMTYAQWLDKLAHEREEKARAEAVLPATALAQAGPRQTRTLHPDPELPAASPPSIFADTDRLEAIARISAEAAELDPTLHRSSDPETQLCVDPDPNPEPCEPDRPAAKADPTFLPAVEYFHAGTQFSIGDITIDPFTIPHDAADPCGFVFRSEGIRMAIATDLGYLPPNVKSALRDVDVLLLESNHDLEMLKDGPYPWSVKQRVLSRVGHLSNLATAEFLSTDYDGGAHTIILAHLSESNNLPELARLAAEEAIGDRMRLLGNRIVLAAQDIPLDPVEL